MTDERRSHQHTNLFLFLGCSQLTVLETFEDTGEKLFAKLRYELGVGVLGIIAALRAGKRVLALGRAKRQVNMPEVGD